MAFKQRSSGLPFKEMGSSPAKQAIGGGAGEAIEHHKKYKATKSTMPKGFNMSGSSKAGKFGKVVSKVFGKVGGKALGVGGMMMATSSKADQPKKGKGKVEYEGGKIDFTKED